MARKLLRLDASKLNRGTPVSTHGASKGMPMVHVGVEMRLSLTYKVDMAQVLGKRNLNKNLQQTNRDVVTFWHMNLRKKHFTTPGFSEYHYKRRTRATIDQKKKAFGHNLPIKKEGDAESLTSNIKKIRSTPTMGSLTMEGPWYLGMRTERSAKSGGGLSPDLKKELTSVSHRDAMLMARYGAKQLRKGLIADKKAKRMGARTVKP